MKVSVTRWCPTLCVYSSGQSTAVGSLSLLQGNLPDPGIKPKSPALPVDSLLAEPQGKPKNTTLGSLSLLQRIFLTQESNRGLLHCRRILYQLTELWEKPQEYNFHLWFYYSFSLHLFPSCNTWEHIKILLSHLRVKNNQIKI